MEIIRCPHCNKRMIDTVLNCYHCGQARLDLAHPANRNIRVVVGRCIDMSDIFEVYERGELNRAAEMLRDRTRLDIKEAEAYLEALYQLPGTQTPRYITYPIRTGIRFCADEIADAWINGQQFKAIMELRKAVYMGLVELKYLLETMENPDGNG